MTLDRKIKWLLGLVVLACVVIVLVVALGPTKSAPLGPMPNPNGYDDFVKGGTMLSTRAYNYNDMKEQELAALVVTNAEALKLLRIGLGRECFAPNNYSRDYAKNLLTDLSLQKDLAFNLCAEGRLAEMQNRTNDAIQSYLDTASFGEKSSQGGIIILKIVGIACESIARGKLRNLNESVDAHQCRKIANTMQSLDATELPLDKIFEQDADYVRKCLGLKYRISMLIHFQNEKNQKTHFITKFSANKLDRRQMMIDFAARAYQLEKGKPPTAVTALVPDYLKAIPKDPVTGSNLVVHASSPDSR